MTQHHLLGPTVFGACAGWIGRGDLCFDYWGLRIASSQTLLFVEKVIDADRKALVIL